MPSSRRRSIPVLLTAMLSIVLLVLALAIEAEAFPRRRDRIANWMAEHERSGHAYSRSQAVAIAERFDVIVAVKGSFRGHVRAMKGANPNLVLLVYVIGTYAWKLDTPGTYPARWYLKDAQGRYVRTKANGNYLMDPTRRGWKDDRKRTCAKFLEYSRYDGCYLDVLGPASLDTGYVTGVPVDRRTGRLWRRRDWLEATGRLAGAVRARVGRLTLGNGLQDGVQFFLSSGPTRLILARIQGAAAEGWLRDAWNPVSTYPSESAWRSNVRMLRDAGSRGDSVFVITKVWSSGTREQKDAWHEFALASFLWADTGDSYFDFSYSPSYDPTDGHPWWRIRLGGAAGRSTIGNVHVRRFQRGVVFVNPTDVAQPISLGEEYRDLRGAVLTSISMPAKSGRILRSVT